MIDMPNQLNFVVFNFPFFFMLEGQFPKISEVKGDANIVKDG